MNLPTLDPYESERLIAAGARLVDVREPDEFARRHIAGAVNAPLSKLGALPAVDAPTIYMCRSGSRTAANCGVLAEVSGDDAFILDGGLEAWTKAGMPVVEDRRQPLEIMRQVQIAAGLLVLAGVAASLLVAPAWIALSAFVGGGLTFAGLSGWCGMAKLLAAMPWNRRTAA